MSEDIKNFEFPGVSTFKQLVPELTNLFRALMIENEQLRKRVAALEKCTKDGLDLDEGWVKKEFTDQHELIDIKVEALRKEVVAPSGGTEKGQPSYAQMAKRMTVLEKKIEHKDKDDFAGSVVLSGVKEDSKISLPTAIKKVLKPLETRMFRCRRMGAAKQGVTRPVLVTPVNTDVLHTNYERIKDDLPDGIRMRKFMTANFMEADKKLFEKGMQEKKEKELDVFVIRGYRLWGLKDGVVTRRWRFCAESKKVEAPEEANADFDKFLPPKKE